MCSQVFLTNSANVFLLEPCQDVPKLLENQLEVCRAVLSVYRHIIMEQNMNRPTWSVTQELWISIELCSGLPAVHKHSAYCLHHIILGSSCCRCCWGSQKQWWRDHRRTKGKTRSPTAWPASSSKWVQINNPRLHTHTPQAFSRLKTRRRRHHPDHVHTLYRAFNRLTQTLFTSNRSRYSNN